MSSSPGTSRWATRSMLPARRSRRSRASTRSSASRCRARTSRRSSTARPSSAPTCGGPGMLHARMIRPAVAGATPVKVDESSIKDIPGARVYQENGFLAVLADKEWDAIKAVRKAQGPVVGRQAAVPRPGQALRSHPQYAGPQAGARGQADRRRRRRVQERGARDRGGIRVAVPVPCLHGTGLRGGRDQGRPGHLLDRLAEAALRAERHLPHDRRAAQQGALDLGGRSRLLWPQRRRRRGDGRRGAGQGDGPSGARAIHPRTGHRLGSERPRLDPPRARRDRRQRQHQCV